MDIVIIVVLNPQVNIEVQTNCLRLEYLVLLYRVHLEEVLCVLERGRELLAMPGHPLQILHGSCTDEGVWYTSLQTQP